MITDSFRSLGARFYRGAIDDAPHLLVAPPRPWHKFRLLAPYVFFDVADGRATEVLIRVMMNVILNLYHQLSSVMLLTHIRARR